MRAVKAPLRRLCKKNIAAAPPFTDPTIAQLSVEELSRRINAANGVGRGTVEPTAPPQYRLPARNVAKVGIARCESSGAKVGAL